MADAGDVLAPGTRLEEFVIERFLGSGGFAVTYLARDESLGGWRAVKEYAPREWGARRADGGVGPRTGVDSRDYQWGLERFLEEARILARFHHRNIVRVYRLFEAGGTAYMVTEHVEGRTLSAEVSETGPMPAARVRAMLLALADGLSVVHTAGLMHRDIKPDNVMLRPDGTPVLIDFGSARQAIGRHSRRLTSVLTPGYAPLEQYSEKGNQGPWTDVYALGAVAYWTLTGQVPDDATERAREDRLPSVADVAPQPVGRRLAAAVDAALAVNEDDRPRSLEAWKPLLEEAQEPRTPQPDEAGGGVIFGSVAGSNGAGGGTASGRRWFGAAALGLAAAALAVAAIALRDETASEGESVRADGEAVIEDPVQEESGPESPEPPPEAVENDDPEPVVVSAGNEEELQDVVDPNSSVGANARSPAAVEEALGLDRATRRMIQVWLSEAGYDTGAADGVFGRGTRAQIRAWQDARGAVVTGYLDAPAVTELAALAVGVLSASSAGAAAAAAEDVRAADDYAAAAQRLAAEWPGNDLVADMAGSVLEAATTAAEGAELVQSSATNLAELADMAEIAPITELATLWDLALDVAESAESGAAGVAEAADLAARMAALAGDAADVVAECSESLGSVSPRTYTRSGAWDGSCVSVHYTDGEHARYYDFTLDSASYVTFDLRSSSADTWLALRTGSGPGTNLLEENDDGGAGTNARIALDLDAGTYTVEATTLQGGVTGPFTLTIAVGAADASDGCSSNLGRLSRRTYRRSGGWDGSCVSANYDAGEYARYYNFTLDRAADLTIDLTSPTVDTWLTLWTGAGTGTDMLVEDDDGGDDPLDARIDTTLDPGTYTIEATTYDGGQTGRFTLTVAVSAP